MQAHNNEIIGLSDRSIQSAGPVSLSPSSLGDIQSNRSKRSGTLTSGTASFQSNMDALELESLGPASLENIASDQTTAANNIQASSSATIKEVLKAGSSKGLKDKKADKTGASDCLNLVSKACFRKIPPSSFYFFFKPKSSRPDFSYSAFSLDKNVARAVIPPTEGQHRGILHDKDFETPKQPTQGKSIKLVGFGMGPDGHDKSVKDKSDVSLGSSLKSEQQPAPETETKSKKKSKKVSKKPKKGNIDLHKNLQGTPEETVEASVFSAVTDKVMDGKAPGQKKENLVVRKRSQASLVDASNPEINKKATANKKTPLKGAKARKPKKGRVPKEEITASMVSAEGAPRSVENESEYIQEDLETDEHGQDKLSENTFQMAGSFVIDNANYVEDAITGGNGSEDDIKVWKSAKIVSPDALRASQASGPTEPADVVVPSSVEKSGSQDSSSSSSSSDSIKSETQVPGMTEKTEEAVVNDSQATPQVLLGSEPSHTTTGDTGAGLYAAGSFRFGTSIFDPTGSFMMPNMVGQSFRASGIDMRVPVEEPRDVLQAVSSCTVQLLQTYNALVEDKSDERWAPIKDLMSVMSYDELTRRRESELEEDFERDTNVAKDENEEEDVLTAPLEVHEDSSSPILGSNVSPSTSTSTLGKKQSKLMPDNFSDKEFMKYFCSDWEHPPFHATAKSAPKDLLTTGRELPKTVSEAIDQIDPNATYDVIFTYKMPKSSPFDLNDSLADVRFKCVKKWMNDTVNASYRAFFDSEIKGRNLENVINQLMEKMVALQLKIRECEDRIKMKPACSQPTVSSKSTFSVDESVPNGSEDIEEEEGIEDSSEHPSDEKIDREIGILMSKLDHIRPEDSKVKEKRTVESADTSATEHSQERAPSDEVSHSCQSRCSSESGSRHVMMETRGKRSFRRKEVRAQLEKVIGLLEKKLNRLKHEIETDQFGDDEQDNEETGEVQPPPTIKKSNSNLPDSQNPPEQDTLLRDIEAKLNRDFFIGSAPKTKSKSSSKIRREIRKSSENAVASPTQRQRLQLYLLGLTDTWNQEEEEDSSLESEIKGERLLDSLKKEDMRAGIKHIKHQKRHVNHLPFDQQKAKVEKNLEDGDSYGKSQASGSTKLKLTGSEQSKTSKSRTTVDPHAHVPFNCKCLCDRVSRFNVKRKDHFRTVMSENLWCLHSNPHLITGNEPEREQPLEQPGAKTLCPPQEIDEPDNFRGWLADTDRSLLLLFNRSPLDRLNKDYYGQPEPEKRQPLPELEKDDAITALKNRMEDSMKKISKQEAEKFWVKVEQWYDDYKKCDKTRQLIEEFEQIDMNAMMKRDLSLLQNEMDEKLKADKKKVKLHLELHHRRNFFENLKKLRDEYECSVRNRLAAKEKEMEARKAFVVQSTLRDMKDKFGPIKEEHKKRCIEWMEQIRDRTNATSQTVKQRQARELALMVDKMDVAERTRQKLVAASGKEHEEMENTLGKAVEERNALIQELNRKVDNLTRDVDIWKRAVREVLNSFKKFMYYILETRPDRAQYFLSLEKLYQIQMDDMIREASDELRKVETSESKLPGKDVELQPTMEIKCPSHDIRYPSERSTRTGSSSDTDIEKDTRNAKVAAHVVDAAIRAVLPTPEMSVEGEDDDRVKELQVLISRFITEDSEAKVDGAATAEEVCEEETTEKSVRGPLVEDTSDPEIPVEEFTRRRIRDMLQIIGRRKPQIKGHIHL